MKKIVVLLALMLGFTSMAQDFKIGLTLAPTINFNKHEYKDANDKWVTDKDGSGGLGWKGGLLADYHFAGNYYIHSGLLIHSKSFDTKDSDMSVTTVEVPVALKLRSKEVTNNVHITGFFGATIDFNVGAKSKIDGTETDVSDTVKSLGTSFMAGAGAEYDLDFGSVGLGLSYHQGLGSIAKSDEAKIISRYLSIDMVFYF